MLLASCSLEGHHLDQTTRGLGKQPLGWAEWVIDDGGVADSANSGDGFATSLGSR